MAQHHRFLKLIDRLHTQVGESDGRRIVLHSACALIARPGVALALDALTFRQWLERGAIRRPPCVWYLNYCCRDDATARGTTWSRPGAGLHYFASRDGRAANAAEGAVLTWPGEAGRPGASACATPITQQAGTQPAG